MAYFGIIRFGLLTMVGRWKYTHLHQRIPHESNNEPLCLNCKVYKKIKERCFFRDLTN